MRVIVCGAGQVGINIARYLSAERNDVTVVDRSSELIEQLAETLDIRAVAGHASSPDVLARAGAEDADMLIAVTLVDEINMIACQVAHSMFNVPTKIARIRRPSYLDGHWADLFAREGMPIDTIISPEREVASAIMRRLSRPGATEMIPFADGRVRLIGVRLDDACPIVNTPLRQLTALFPDLNINVVGIIRGERKFVPKARDQMLVGDEVYFIVDNAHVTRAMAAFGHEEKEAERAVIIGGGNIGHRLASLIEEELPHVRLRLIERDRGKAAELTDTLRRTTVLQGDALSEELLEEANFENADLTIALTDDDETNILASLLAKRAGSSRTVALINKSAYSALVSPLDIDVVINPRAITVSQILQHVRRGRVLAAFSIGDDFGEALEVEILETSVVADKDLRVLKMPAGSIVGAILRGDNVIIPRGRTLIRAGDRVVLFSMTSVLKRVEQMFAVRLEFF